MNELASFPLVLTGVREYPGAAACARFRLPARDTFFAVVPIQDAVHQLLVPVSCQRSALALRSPVPEWIERMRSRLVAEAVDNFSWLGSP